jgi:hypothetical protein
VEAHAQPADDLRIVTQARLVQRVADDLDPAAGDGGLGKRLGARYARKVVTAARLEPEVVGIVKGQRRDRRIEHARGQRDDGVELRLGLRSDDIVAMQRGETLDFPQRTSPSAVPRRRENLPRMSTH